MARRRSATRRRRRTSQVAVFRANPIRRRRRRSPARARRRSYLRNPAPRRARRRRSMSVRRFRRNPSSRRGMSALNFGKSLLPAVFIGVGAVGAEIIMGYLPIPAQFKTGVLRHVTKGVVAVAAGMLIGKVLRQKKIGNFIALGGVVIAAHDALKEVITSRMPAIPFGQYVPTVRGSLGEYLPRSSVGPGLGYYSPAATVDYSAMGESPEFQA